MCFFIIFRIANQLLLARGPTEVLSDSNYPCPNRCSNTKQVLSTTDSKNLTRESNARNQGLGQTVWVLSVELPSIIPYTNSFLASYLSFFSKDGRTANILDLFGGIYNSEMADHLPLWRCYVEASP